MIPQINKLQRIEIEEMKKKTKQSLPSSKMLLRKKFPGGLVVKVMSLLWHRVDLWPENSQMPKAKPKKKKKKKIDKNSFSKDKIS